jgi:beta-hydroxylase
MRIEKEHINWQEGKTVVFDDTYEHEVWNNTGEVRVVLLLDVIRPFKKPLSFINKAIVNLIGNSSYVKEAMKNHQQWETTFHTARRNSIPVV